MGLSVKEHIQGLISILPVGFLLLDESGNCVGVNSAFEKLTGVSETHLLGRGWMAGSTQENLNVPANLLSGKVIELTLRTASSQTRMHLTPAKIDENLYCCTVVASNEPADLTGKQHLMQQLLDCTDAILYSVDLYGLITSFNRAASQAVRLRKGVDICLGDYWPDIVSGNTGLDKEKMEVLLKYVLDGNSYKTTEDISTENGGTLTYSVQASPLYNEEKEITGAVLCAHNITVETRLQRDAAQKALIRTQELEHWNQFHDMLLSVLAHDLRQPLSGIILSADTVTYMQDKLSSKDLTGIMDNLRITSKKSIELLEGLLHWVASKKQDFSYEQVPLNLYDLIEEANVLFLQDQHKRGICLRNEVKEDQTIYGHEQMMLFILRNLISNATKFAFNDSAIIISADVSENRLTISVRDNGKGMTSEQLSELFSIKKPNVTTSGIKGAGVALTIAYDMVGKMNGNIFAESEPEKGTTFYLTFPSDKG